MDFSGCTYDFSSLVAYLRCLVGRPPLQGTIFRNGPDFVPVSFHDFDVGVIGGHIRTIGHSALGPM
jgi:hypothetical protein